MNPIRKRKLSIDDFSLPKIRHKSIHVEFTNLQSEKSQKSFVLNSILVQRKNHKSLSKLQRSLSRHRSHFQQISKTNHVQLNTTFSKQQKLDELYKQKNKLQKKKAYTMENHSSKFSHNMSQSITNSSIIKKRDKKAHLFDPQKQQSCSGPIIIIDYKIEMSWLRHQCNDSIFQLSRIGSTLNFYNNQLFLFGGSPDVTQNNLIFHKFKIQSNEWKHISSTGSKPILSLMYHSSTMYRESIIICGGISIQKNQLKKLFSPYIFSFNTATNVWSQYNWGIYVKHHGTCIVNNWLIIHGGISEKQSTISTLHIVLLSLNNNLQYSKTLSIPTSLHLSHHKLITTLNQESRLRTRFKLDGLITFGGKNQNQELNNKIFFIESKQIKVIQEGGHTYKKWQTIQVTGPSPSKRMAHSFELLKNKGLALMVGGLNQKNEYLSDMWILDLFSLQWTLIEQIPLLSQTGGIAYHSSCLNDSQIYIYGGLTKEKVDKQFYLIETQKFKRQLSKHQTKRKVETSTFSIKGFQ